MSEYTKPIMIQGTMSNAGKGILAIGPCRIFYQDGYRIASFKFQGIALNSYITPEELEVGRTQVVQAEAAGTIPYVDMNPIFLEPATDVGSQVVVYGISRDNMKARDYLAYKKSLVPDIMVSHRRLEEQYDVIVIEGVGSPAEINLEFYDIVNVGMVDMTGAPVLLAGGIDRSDVFARLYDAVSLLVEEERRRVKGLTINRFRGGRSILEPGISMLEVLCHIPVVGVILYMDVDIDDEDSLSNRLETGKSKAPAAVDLTMICFPRVSNFTDFSVFSGVPGVPPRHITKACDLSSPDMVILPDTRNTIQDLLWMHQNGLEAAILKLADHQMLVWGIYGGYQMMGEVLEDAMGVESDLPSRTAGMGLPPLKTELEEEKIRARVEGAFGESDDYPRGLSGKSIEGCKIHMDHIHISREEGAANTARIASRRREPKICRPMDHVMETGKDRILSRQARMDGWNRGNIYGTYVHGVFDNPRAARAVAEALATARGLYLEQVAGMDYRAYREQQYDKLIESLRRHPGMDVVYRIMGTSPKEKGEEKLGDGYTVGTGITGGY